MKCVSFSGEFMLEVYAVEVRWNLRNMSTGDWNIQRLS